MALGDKGGQLGAAKVGWQHGAGLGLLWGSGGAAAGAGAGFGRIVGDVMPEEAPQAIWTCWVSFKYG